MRYLAIFPSVVTVVVTNQTMKKRTRRRENGKPLSENPWVHGSGYKSPEKKNGISEKKYK